MNIKLVVINLILLLSLSSKKLIAQPVQVKTIKIKGNTIFIQKVETLVNSYINLVISAEKLKELASSITDLYIEQGYLTSGAFLPEQEISSGIVEIQVVEGGLEKIEIEGLKRLKPNYINSRLKRATQSPLNINKLENALRTLRSDPLISEVQAQIIEGTTLNASILLLNIEEAPLLKGKIEVNNRSSPTIGEIKGEFAFKSQNLFGLRETLSIQYDLTEGFSTYELNSRIPLNFQETTISLSYRQGETRIIEEPFDDINIRAEADTFSVGLVQPLVRSPTTFASIGLSFDRSVSETSILDRPFSFADGVQNGLSKISAFRFETNYTNRSDKQIFSISSRLNFGVNLFNATVNNSSPDGIFFSSIIQTQWAKVLDRDSNIIFIARGFAQLTPDSLLPLEKISLGGQTKVRGYSQNSFIGDNAVKGTVEIAFTVAENKDWGKVELSPFVDIGRVWDTEGEIGQSLASIGFGIDWLLTDSIFLELDFGIPIIDVEERRKNNISFSLSIDI